MTPNIQVVVAFDFTPSAGLALQRAVEFVFRGAGHVLHVVSILDDRGTLLAGDSSGIDHRSADEVRRHVLEQVAAKVTERSPGAAVEAWVEVCVHARIGRPAQEILAVAAEVGADIIFIGSHGVKGLERLLLGSVSERVVREAHCAVLVARERTYPQVARQPTATARVA